ncbi:chromosome segregation protein Spc25-domain-containing protein [Suillus plorans]|uniref:Kinetochore protein SPC25 n=1 Tax=Suillus plorans TaxID=116603 RepID=A0A9P7E3F8_9AGAM|nr:chromosome segregation protein Spc25-domain-containing protein [Suillus plorans]KAG1809918.1 chromosome segregation protein Spc25-domain-containing protein [Suillus plorans]
MPQVRPTHIDLASILAEPNPSVDLRLYAYEASTSNFLRAVTNYANRAVAEITKHRNAQEADKKRLVEKTVAVKAETNQCKVKEIELLAVMEREKEEVREAETSITALKRQLASIRETCQSVDAEIEQYRALTANLKREKDRERQTLEMHAAQTGPELNACETRLRCHIEGIEKDRLLIRFTHIDKLDIDREFSFVLDVASSSNQVITTTPPLPNLPILLNELNETRDIFHFIRSMRSAFALLVEKH